MNRQCPRCGFVEHEDDEPNEDDIAALRKVVRENGGVVLAGDRVRIEMATILVDRAPRTLREWRDGFSFDPSQAPLPFQRDGRGRIYYSLRDIAKFLAKSGG